ARGRKARGQTHTGWHSAKAAEKCLGPLPQLWMPAAKCAEPARTRCVRACRRAARRPACLSEEAAAPMRQPTGRRRPAWMSGPPGTRGRLLLSLKIYGNPMELDDSTALSSQARANIVRHRQGLLDAGSDRWPSQVVSGKPEIGGAGLAQFF